MSIACTLGLIACLNYKDTTIDFEDAVEITQTCLWMDDYPAGAYMGGSHNGTAYFRAEELWDLGLRFEWNPPDTPEKRTARSEQVRMEFRKAAVLRECRKFESLFHNKRLWENSEKMAY